MMRTETTASGLGRCGPDSWQAVALELLRRRAGAEPRVPTEHLRDLGRHHEPTLREKRIDNLYYAVCQPDHPRQRLYQAACDHRIRETRELLRELELLDVEALILDENEGSIRYDRSVAMVETSTITLLVSQGALWKAQKVLYGRGYVQGDYDPDTREWVCVEHERQLRYELQSCALWPFKRALRVTGLDDEAHHEARRQPGFLVREDATLLCVTVEVRHALSPSLETSAVFQRSIPGVGGGRALSRADQLWSSISRWYEEIASGADRTLRGLVGVAPLVADTDVDWALLVRTAVSHKATSAHLYWLRFFHALGATAVRAGALQELWAHHQQSERDWGWQLEVLFDIAPTLPRRLTAGEPTELPAPPAVPTWQPVAIELLRRRAGGEPLMTTEHLRGAGARYEADLTRKRIDGLYFVECGVSHPRQHVYQALWNAQVREARGIIAELSALGVSPLVLKGVELGARYDHDRGVCERSDIDLLIPRDDLWKAKKVLYGRGYAPVAPRSMAGGHVPTEHRIQTRHELQAYEIAPFVKAICVTDLDEAALQETRRSRYFRAQDDGTAAALVKVDVHHNILFNFDCRAFISRSVPSSLGQGRTFCPADHLWFLMFRYYGEAAIGRKRGLRGLAWIAPMLSDPEVDWDLFVRTAVELRATSPAHYWLTFFRGIGARRIPESVSRELERHRARCERDWGWQLERWFELPESVPELLEID